MTSHTAINQKPAREPEQQYPFSPSSPSRSDGFGSLDLNDQAAVLWTEELRTPNRARDDNVDRSGVSCRWEYISSRAM